MSFIITPLRWVVDLLYSWVGSYGVAIILFTLAVKLVLLPLDIKQRHSMRKMQDIQPKIEEINKKYEKDPEKRSAKTMELYKKEKVNPMSGCLWSFIPILFLMVLYGIIREPLVYLMNVPSDMINTVAEITGVANTGTYPQIAMLEALTDPAMLEQVKAALGNAGADLFSMNVEFLGISLAKIPQLNFWTNGLDWGSIGLFLLPLVSVATSVLSMYVSLKTNQMNRGGEQNDQMAKTNRTMMIMMPLMSLWIGFMMPVAMCVYWIANSLFSVIQELIAGKILKKDYEAARAAAAERERQEKEEEKRRKEEARLERQRRLEEEKKNRGKKHVKKDEPTEPGVNKDDSRIGIRAYARGRAYIPERFGGVTEYRDMSDLLQAEIDAEQQKKGKKNKKAAPAQEKKEETAQKPETEALPKQETAPAEQPAVQQSAPETPEEQPVPVQEPAETEEVEVEVEQIEVELPEEEDDKKEGV